MLMRAATLAQPRALGDAALRVKTRAGETCIDRLRHSGALKLLFPQRTQPLQAVIVNTAGGITGGDRFQITATAGPEAQLTLTTQAAERAYRAQPGETGMLETHLVAEEHSQFAWLPQETILFDGAGLRRSLRVDLAPNARFLMVEPLIFGRQAMGEEIRDLRFDDAIDIRRSGDRLYCDGMRWHGDVAAQLDRPAIAAGARAMASLLYAAPDAEAHLDPLRETLSPIGGASLLAPDILVARCLAADGFALRRGLLPALDRLTRNQLPKSWRL